MALNPIQNPNPEPISPIPKYPTIPRRGADVCWPMQRAYHWSLEISAPRFPGPTWDLRCTVCYFSLVRLGTQQCKRLDPIQHSNILDPQSKNPTCWTIWLEDCGLDCWIIDWVVGLLVMQGHNFSILQYLVHFNFGNFEIFKNLSTSWPVWPPPQALKR